VLAVALAVALAGCGLDGHRAATPPVTGAVAWLARYVQPDGRVARQDQGGDTVSEGQSYALALAVAAGDTVTFDRVWAWTRTHLQRPDALLAFHADAQGRVLDNTPATDADVVTAWALLRRAGTAAQDGRRLAAAVLARETTTVAGRPVLAAGPWATGRPATLNPSYWAFPILRQLATLDGDPRWNALADTAATLTSTGGALPADWLRADGTVVQAEPAPDRSRPGPQYGPDAQRVLLWSAYSCRAADRDVARRAAVTLRGRQASTALSSDLSGHVLQSATTPLAQLAAGASAQIAGDLAGAGRLRAAAAASARTYPSYYGDAWVALDQASGKLFGSC
jgi:endo-1,4-beta-D-glucanase Y